MAMTNRTKAFALLASAALIMTACGDDDDDGGAAEETAASAAAPETTAADITAAPATTPEETTAETTTEATEPEATTAPEPPTGEPVKIGILTSITSNFAPWGLQVRDGAQLAVDEINASGGAGWAAARVGDRGRPEQPPRRPCPRTSGWSRKVSWPIGGIISSSVGGATAPLAESNQIPTFLVKSGDQTILTPDSRFTFRTCLPAAPMVAGPIIEYAQENGLTKIGAIVADYPWGHAFQSSIETAVADADGIELHLEVAPVPEQDFTTYLRAIDEFGPDLLVATGHPPGGGPIIAQSNDLGMEVPVIGAYSPWALVMGGAGDAGARPVRRLRLRRLPERRSTRSWPAASWRCRPTTRSWTTTPSPRTAS